MSRDAWLSSALLAVTLAFAFNFHRKQNGRSGSGAWTGGEISWPKAFWLAYALGSWFLVPWIFFLDPAVSAPFKAVIVIQLVSWWIRGPLELFMIYRWFNWTPVYGISHDVVHNVVLFGATAVAAAKIGWGGIAANPSDLCVLSYLVSICFAMMAEVVFAALFIATRGLGKDKIYFASDSPEFRLINRLTLAVCVIVYSHWVVQTAWMFHAAMV